MGNLDAQNAEKNDLLVTLSIERGGRWFHLARHYDPGYSQNGPKALARFLGLAVGEVSPISYDVREYGKDNPPSLAGSISKEVTGETSHALGAWLTASMRFRSFGVTPQTVSW